jgi:hypothetical protein
LKYGERHVADLKELKFKRCEWKVKIKKVIKCVLEDERGV